MAPLGVLDDSDEPYGNTGKFRLWTRVKYTITCKGGFVDTIVEKSRESKTGKEGPFQAPNGNFIRTVAEVDPDTHVGSMGYMFTGRPPLQVEPSFQLMKFRTCPYIWHYPYLKIDTCDGKGWDGNSAIGGSNFPTRAFWLNNPSTPDIEEQGPIGDLWHCSPASMNMFLVAGSFPFGVSY